MAVEPATTPTPRGRRPGDGGDEPPELPPSLERLERRAKLRRRQRTKRVVGASLAAIVVAWGAYAFTIRGEAAPGVKVAGVDVGGLDREAAKERLARELAPRLAAPVQVTIGQERVAVTPTALGIGLDIDAMVDDALTGRPRLVPADADRRRRHRGADRAGCRRRSRSSRRPSAASSRRP